MNRRYALTATLFIPAVDDQHAMRLADHLTAAQKRQYDNSFSVLTIREVPAGSLSKGRLVAGVEELTVGDMSHSLRAWIENNLETQFNACITEWGGYNAETLIGYAKEMGFVKKAVEMQQRLLQSQTIPQS